MNFFSPVDELILQFSKCIACHQLYIVPFSLPQNVSGPAPSLFEQPAF